MEKFYAAIFGAGIAGTAIANELANRNKKVLLIDPNVSETAPGPPAALVNPATGRRAKMSWNVHLCLPALRDLITELQDFAEDTPIISDTGAIRPAINEKLAENFRESLEKYDWPKGWIRWMEKDDVMAFNPNIAPNHGALFLDVGFTVLVDNYQNIFRQYLRDKGVDCRYETAQYHHHKKDDGFTIQFGEGTEAEAEHVIIAAGHQTPFFEDWEYLPLHRVKGQIVHFEADQDLEWEHATSAMGYSLRRGKRDLIVGSTYEHKFEDLSTSEKAFVQIKGKLEKMYPGLVDKVHKKNQMAGVRVTTPNKLPVIGRHPEHKNLCIYTAMGSKGLLFSQYVGSLLAEHLVGGAAIPEELDTKRFDGD
ncbi:NAD(P)/FAD-dependent oxidoreductase [Gracilimonas mengyeensis]|uniref:Glycine/D-amino acid oxidase n=1 Tax=Gracilimonas mengyeensis TaxID=1302730 RepID=A0A521BYF2_9BACT|nr:FAD-dependent oxidoreductase [Gracilimonas mengyeensis]SMO52218.1 Glycine/D-amino acid oxidase [Gracilimonas mengyeensis]